MSFSWVFIGLRVPILSILQTSIFGVYRPHMKLYLELLLSTVVYLALFTSSMSHVTIGWAKILASTKAIIGKELESQI